MQGFIPALATPTLGNRATNVTNARFPGLWRGLTRCFNPSLSPSMPYMLDAAGSGKNGVFNKDAAKRFVGTKKGHVMDAPASVYPGNIYTFRPPNSQDFSLSIWFYSTLQDTDTEGFFAVACKYVGTTNLGFFIRVYNSGGNQKLKAGFTYDNYNIFHQTDTSGLYLELRWEHCVIIKTGTTAAVYYNGNAVTLTSAVGSLGAATLDGDVYIGDAEVSTHRSNTPTGYIGEVCTWNRALTGNEARLLYSGASPTYKVPSYAQGMVGSAAPGLLGGTRALLGVGA